MALGSPALLRTLTGSHEVLFDARVLTTYQTGPDPVGDDIPVLSGAVIMDATAQVRRSINMETLGVNERDLQTAWPHRGHDGIAPYRGHEVFVRRGVSLGPGAEPLMTPLGYFRLETTEQSDPPYGQIRLLGQDRMRAIIRSRPLTPRTFKASRTVQSVVEEIVHEVYPTCAILFDDLEMADETIGRDIVMDDSRYEPLAELANSYGKSLRFTRFGELGFRTAPAGMPVWTVADGQNGVRVGGGRRLATGDVINGWVITGEGIGLAAAYGAAVDRGPNSPTRWGPVEDGAFGMFPGFEASPLVKNDNQAERAAIEKLRRTMGAPYSVDSDSVVNPELEEEDPIEVLTIDNTIQSHIVDRLTMPLDEVSALPIETREQSLISIGPPL